MIGAGTNHSVQVTFFPDHGAATKREEAICLPDLMDRITSTSAASKSGLPWLKLATFGDKTTGKGSLRSNENLKFCTGIEADYDAERVSFNDAIAILKETGIACIVYTSPSHTDAKPRWRVLCWFSRPMLPEQRGRYMGRLNGLLHGIIAAESWTLSQSYYYGSVNRNPHHRAVLIEGTPIDLMDDLDAGAIGKPEKLGGNANERPVSAGGVYVPVSDARLDSYRRSVLDKLRREAVDGQKHTALRDAALRMGGIQVAAGFTDAEAVQWLQDALPDSVVDWAAAKETAAWGLARGREKPIVLDDRPNPKANGAHRPDPQPLAPDDIPLTPPPASGADYSDPNQGDEPQARAEPSPGDQTDSPELRVLLSIEAWAVRDIPEPDRLLGDLITKTTRMFLVGRTGLGKTLLGIAIAAGVASGEGFLHWRSSRPARVVYLDGEMPAELIKPRAVDAMRRLGVPIPPENLLIFGRDIEDEARRICPNLPPFAPLNTDEGRLFMVALLAAIGGVDLIIFDNVMSLISGSMKEEEPWLATVPLVTMLTGRQIGQLWLDHTGHNTDRQYGTSTKAWQFDAVGQMAPVVDEKADPRATAFTLSFDYPGKARRRTPDNWAEFQTQTIRLTDDRWTAEPSDQQTVQKPTRPGPKVLAQYQALADALVVSPTVGKTTRDAWYAECVRLGLEKPVPDGAKWAVRDRLEKGFRTRMSGLKVGGWIGIDGEVITDLNAQR